MALIIILICIFFLLIVLSIIKWFASRNTIFVKLPKNKKHCPNCEHKLELELDNLNKLIYVKCSDNSCNFSVTWNIAFKESWM